MMAPFARFAWSQDSQRIQGCDIFADPLSWNGKLVSVSGDVVLGMEIFALNLANCPNVPTSHGLKWPTSIHLVGRSLGVSGYPTDRTSKDFFMEILELVRKAYFPRWSAATPKPRIKATLVGVLRISDRFGKFLQEGDQGPYLDGGYGHFGMFPVQLEFVAVEEVSLSGLKIFGASE